MCVCALVGGCAYVCDVCVDMFPHNHSQVVESSFLSIQLASAG